jgi:hypothetical protein
MLFVWLNYWGREKYSYIACIALVKSAAEYAIEMYEWKANTREAN